MAGLGIVLGIIVIPYTIGHYLGIGGIFLLVFVMCIIAIIFASQD